MRLKDKVAIVTGSTSGIGRAIALALAAEGARVVVNGRHRQAAEEVAGEIRRSGGTALAVSADVTSADQVDTLAEEVLASFGRVDILVNNAGGVAGSVPTKYMEEVRVEDWDRAVDLNLKGPFLVSRAVAKPMREQGGGKIIHITSEAARNIHRGPTARIEYTAAKAGVIGLTRAMAIELGPYGINVNAVAPGWTLSREMHLALWESMSTEEKERVLQQTPLRRLAQVDDIAPVVVFLASDDARYITGATIDVNGGHTVT